MSSLPEHLINQIIDKIPIHVLVKKYALSVPTMIDSYVNEYINIKLLTDLEKSHYLFETPLYKGTITNKIISISQKLAQQFIKISGNSINISDYLTNPITLIKLEILIEYTLFLKQQTSNNYKLTITNFNTNGNNNCHSDNNGNICSINFNQKSIINEIMIALFKHININNNDLTYPNFNISSMKIIKSYYPNGLNDNSIDETLINFL
jgi:hypothetical protein